MSIEDVRKIDAVGVSKRDRTVLLFMLSDHLDWEDETAHLFLLQDKLNAYLDYIEAEEYSNLYPDSEFQSYVIMIGFLHPITENCKKFLRIVNDQAKEYNITITYDIGWGNRGKEAF